MSGAHMDGGGMAHDVLARGLAFPEGPVYLGPQRVAFTQIRGQWFPWHGRLTMPIFHPAYLLRNPSREPGSPKALTWRDIKLVKQEVDALAGG